MWCLETIIALNKKAMEMYIEGRHIAEAYAATGINSDLSVVRCDEYTNDELDLVVSDLQENKNVEITSSRWI